MAAPAVPSAVISAIGASTSRELAAHATRDAGDLILEAAYLQVGTGRTNEPITDADFCPLCSIFLGTEVELVAYARIATDDAADTLGLTWGGASIFNFAEGARVTGNATSQIVHRVGKVATGTGTTVTIPGFTLPAGRDYRIFVIQNTVTEHSLPAPSGWTKVEQAGGFFHHKAVEGGGEVADFIGTYGASEEWGGVMIAIADTYTPPSEETEPKLVGTKETVTTSNATSITAAIPDGANVSGRRLVTIASKDGNGAITWPGGWERLYDGVDGDNLNRMEVRYRDLTGSEYAGTGATVKLEGASEEWAVRTLLYEEGTFDLERKPAIDSARLGEGNANPPNLQTPWGEAMAQWLVACTVDSAASQSAPSAYPTNYTGNQYAAVTSANEGSVIVASATRNLKAKAENPGTFTNRNDGNVAVTMAIKGAANEAAAPASLAMVI